MIKFQDIMDETTNTIIEYGYHYTSKENYENIKIEGLKINQKNHLTNTFGGESWVKTAYGIIPIFLSVKPMTGYGPRMPIGSEYDWVLLKVNVKGLDIAADLGTLIDHGAYIEEDGFWFKRKPNWLVSDEYSYSDLQGSDTFDLQTVIKKTGTFVVLQDIEVNRIQKIKERGKSFLSKFF